eukprot:3223855-Pleurochrysis_carterae.AAC.1
MATEKRHADLASQYIISLLRASNCYKREKVREDHQFRNKAFLIGSLDEVKAGSCSSSAHA